MKLLFVTIACVITYVTACDDLSMEELRHLKCTNEIAFRGQMISGTSSLFNDGPYQFAYQRTTFRVIADYKSNINQDQITVFTIRPARGFCSGSPYGDGDAIVFANMNSTYNMYQVFPCSVNPSASCVDLEAFNDLTC